MAERLPVVLVFEDMHWADQALLTFVEYLLEWSRDHRLFVLGARPARAGRAPGRLRGDVALVHVARARAARA